jgi:histidyl-tRNA synthetase
VAYFEEHKVLQKDQINESSKRMCVVFESPDFLSKVADEMTSHNEALRKAKLPKGTRDSDPAQMAIKNYCIGVITSTFKMHGALEIDTPVFELKETLMGKYGEESKLIYDLVDQGGELLSLRYDLTVPFARFMAIKNQAAMKRFHIGKVYRRETPQMAKGRYREFYQCDFDIAGAYSPMIPEAEALSIIPEVLHKLDIHEFVTIINHRGLLGAMVELAGCEPSKFKTICSSIDKLDKTPWEEVCQELTEVKGLTAAQAEKLHQFTQLKGKPKDLLRFLQEKRVFGDHVEANAVIVQMQLLAQYAEALKIEDSLLFDLSLARGLDYYTGLILEVKLTETKYGVGSICGGGRYDNLIGMFSGKQIPAVGFSFGIERLFTILEDKLQGKLRACATKVLISSIGKDLVAEKLRICRELWSQGIEVPLFSLISP